MDSNNLLRSVCLLAEIFLIMLDLKWMESIGTHMTTELFKSYELSTIVSTYMTLQAKTSLVRT